MLLLSPFKNCSWTTKRNRNINTISTKLCITLTALLDKGPRCSECHDEGHSRGDTCLQLYLEQGHRVIFSQNRWYSLRETLTRPYLQPCQVCARLAEGLSLDHPPAKKGTKTRKKEKSHTLLSQEWSIGEAESNRWLLHSKQYCKGWSLLAGEKRQKEITETTWITRKLNKHWHSYGKYKNRLIINSQNFILPISVHRGSSRQVKVSIDRNDLNNIITKVT